MARPVTVSPEAFTMVHYEAAEIADVVRSVADAVGFDPGVGIEVMVDEGTPQGRARVTGLDPLRIEAESGAFEDPKRPRRWSRSVAVEVVGRLLLRAVDRLDPAFGEPPADDDLTLAESVAWDAYCLGRLSRALGGRTPTQRDRRRYHFRLRHGFTDAADATFDRLWDGTGLTWADVSDLSRSALEIGHDQPIQG